MLDEVLCTTKANQYLAKVFNFMRGKTNKETKNLWHFQHLETHFEILQEVDAKRG